MIMSNLKKKFISTKQDKLLSCFQVNLIMIVGSINLF